jgi:hypothetical protein
MVCFSVHILIPEPGRESNRIALEQRIQYIVKQCTGQVYKILSLENQQYYEIRTCDEDTVSLLRDLPTPFTVVKVDYLQSGENLYTYRKHCSPPRIHLLKQIYWLAKSTERWRLPISNVLSQTK